MPPTPAPKRRALGKGMDALFPNKASEKEARPVLAQPDARRGLLKVAIEDVHPNPHQPRKSFDHDLLEGLAQSIKDHGLLQPVIVRKRTPDGYSIVAGERRWRAAQKAGHKSIEVIVKDLTDPDAYACALIENLQREDLNPIEQAMAFQHLIDEQKLTQDQLAAKIGKDRTTVTNALRLLRLPAEIRRQVIAGNLSMGHARALLSLESDDDMVKASRETLKRGLSVRQVEKLVRGHKPAGSNGQTKDGFGKIPGGAAAIERETELLQRRFGTKVRIQVEGKKGRVEIDFGSPDELDRLLELLKGDR
ncbi:MAG: ParB/RepB/Spo0J family partition protein [Deltaproteobacteria bacterium]|nr:ParB/RepB/Spo0J family partition protein [Deltaproteobacteria bacterium]